MQRRKKEGVGETRIMMPGEFIETHKRALWLIQRKPCHKTLFIMPQLASLKGENTVKVSLPGPVAFSCCLRLTLCGIGCLSPANASLISDLLIFTFSVCVLFLPSIWVLFSFDCNFYFHILLASICFLVFTFHFPILPELFHFWAAGVKVHLSFLRWPELPYDFRCVAHCQVYDKHWYPSSHALIFSYLISK